MIGNVKNYHGNYHGSFFGLKYEGFSVVLNERKIIVVSGFLGSGKTTFLLKKSKEITATGTSCAVIVNEASELGVDNIEYSAMGLKVAEIFGGCICCSLALDLKNTLRILDEGYKIETVLVEPSGVADIGEILQVFKSMGIPKRLITNILLLDCSRIEMLMEVLEPLTLSTINAADEVVLSKSDIATPEQVKTAVAFVKNHRPDLNPVA